VSALTLTVKDIATDLRVHEDTIYRALWAGKLRGTKHSFGWRIAPSDYRKWLDHHSSSPADEKEALKEALYGRR
jgi:excisionase family DNA binding protein